MSDQKVIGGPDAPHRLADPITPDALRALADGITVGDLIDHNLRAAADRIEALDAAWGDAVTLACQQARTIEALTAERDEAVARLTGILDAGDSNAEFQQRRLARAFLSRQEAEG